MRGETAVLGPAHRCAVIGSPVGHSLSPVLHRAAYDALGLTDWVYERREVASTRLGSLLDEVAAQASAGGPVWHGLSVTMPHKQALLTRLDVVDPLAVAVGAVNTVVAQRSGTGAALLAGFNTDVAGIVTAVREVRAGTADVPAGPGTSGPGTADGAPGPGLTAVVLGSGATACSSLAALTELGATRITVAARRHAGPGRALTAAHRMGLDVEAITWRGPQDAGATAELATRLAAADLVVSTLPPGAADALAEPLSAAAGHRAGAVGTLLDVVYDPWPTPLAAAWQGAGGTVAPGWLMLLHQAGPQVRLMTGYEPPLTAMREALATALAQR